MIFPSYPSSRLVGIELEADGGPNHDRVNFPDDLPGWSRKDDSSLNSQGYEYVLEPAVPLADALPKVQALCSALRAGKCLVHTKGSLHVHVQAHDLDHEAALRLVRLYHCFQPHISLLVGPSRLSSHYCKVSKCQTLEALKADFRLDEPAPSRAEAKQSRQFAAVNAAMLRVNNPAHRSIEFRQGSASTRPDSIYGWACLMAILVDVAAAGIQPDYETLDGMDFDAFCLKIDTIATAAGGQGMAEWLRWRAAFMGEAKVNPEKVVAAFGARAHGVFFVAKKFNISAASASDLCRRLERGGDLTKVRAGYWRPAYAQSAAADLLALREAQTSHAFLHSL